MTTGRAVAVIAVVLALCTVAGRAEAGCTISTIGVAFGNYDVFSATSLTTTGAIMLDCKKKDKRVSIQLSTGSSGTYVSRTLRGAGADVLNYNLYIDGPNGPIWGNGTGGTSFFSDSRIGDTAVVLTVYGRISPWQDVRAGAYSDSVVAEVNF